MRFVRRTLLWSIGILAALILLSYLSGNDHIPRGVRYTYLIGRSAPEIDDRDFFPSTEIAAHAPVPWPVAMDHGTISLTREEEARLEELHTASFAVFRNDSLLLEKYWDPWTAESVINSFSVAKSYVSLLTGITMGEGLIESVFQPVGDFLPEYKEGCHARINLWHLLSMSTGLDWSESGSSPFSDNAKGYYGSNVRELALGQPCREEPGREFDYISGSTQIMAEVLEAIHGRPLNELVEEKIWRPLGAEHSAWWGKDREDGDYKAFCCLYATTRDFARIGQLYLDSGVWHGKQILPREFWHASITPAALMDKGEPNARYGYYWWLSDLDGDPIYYARGFHGQYVVVIPHERIVFVRTGTEREEVNATGHPTDVFDWIAIARAVAARRP